MSVGPTAANGSGSRCVSKVCFRPNSLSKPTLQDTLLPRQSSVRYRAYDKSVSCIRSKRISFVKWVAGYAINRVCRTHGQAGSTLVRKIDFTNIKLQSDRLGTSVSVQTPNGR